MKVLVKRLLLATVVAGGAFFGAKAQIGHAYGSQQQVNTGFQTYVANCDYAGYQFSWHYDNAEVWTDNTDYQYFPDSQLEGSCATGAIAATEGVYCNVMYYQSCQQWTFWWNVTFPDGTKVYPRINANDNGSWSWAQTR